MCKFNVESLRSVNEAEFRSVAGEAGVDVTVLKVIPGRPLPQPPLFNIIDNTVSMSLVAISEDGHFQEVPVMFVLSSDHYHDTLGDSRTINTVISRTFGAMTPYSEVL